MPCEQGQTVASGAASDGSRSIRRATAEDGDFLATMLTEAINWPPEWNPESRHRVLSAPAQRATPRGGRDTGLGVIAEAGSQPIPPVRFLTKV